MAKYQLHQPGRVLFRDTPDFYDLPERTNVRNLENLVGKDKRLAGRIAAGVGSLYWTLQQIACGGGSAPAAPSNPDALRIVSHVPTGNLPAGRTETPFGPTTNKAALCKYNPGSDKPYNQMPLDLSTSPTTTHQITLRDLSPGRLEYWVACVTPDGNEMTPGYKIVFEVTPSQDTKYNARTKVVTVPGNNPASGGTVTMGGKTVNIGGDGYALVEDVNPIRDSKGNLSLDGIFEGGNFKGAVVSFLFGDQKRTYDLGEIAVPSNSINGENIDLELFRQINTTWGGVHHSGIQKGTVNYCKVTPTLVVHTDTYNSSDQRMSFPAFTEASTTVVPRYTRGPNSSGGDFTRRAGPVPSSDSDRLRKGEFLIWRGTSDDTGDNRFTGKVVILVDNRNCITSSYYVHVTDMSRSMHFEEIANGIGQNDFKSLGGPLSITNDLYHALQPTNFDYAVMDLSNALLNGVTVTNGMIDYRTLGYKSSMAISVQPTTSATIYQLPLEQRTTTTPPGNFGFSMPNAPKNYPSEGPARKITIQMDKSGAREISEIRQPYF